MISGLAPEGRIFILLPLAAALLLAGAGWTLGLPVLIWSALPLVLAGLFSAFFFRDPERTPPADQDLLVAPADGRVTAVGPPEGGVSGSLRISIFLSLLDVHLNRAPAEGTVRAVHFRPGRFRAAFRADAARENEHSEMELVTDGGTVVVRQIVGVLARRIVCRARPGDRLGRGERFGLIRFGSRTDVVLPSGVTALVRPGDRVRGGETPIGRWP